MEPIRILLVEDEPMWQQAMQALLAADSRFELVGVADNAESALAAFAETRPEVVLLDWKIRGNRDGLEVGQTLLEKGLPSHRIVLVSGSDPASIPAHPFLYVPKNRIASELLPLLESVTIN